MRNKEKKRAAYARWYLKNGDRMRARARDYGRKRSFGLTPADYEAMVVAQDGVCAVCRRVETSTYRGVVRALAVDHCHETGAIRSLLCHRCNVALGMARSDPATLRQLASYLETSRGMIPDGNRKGHLSLVVSNAERQKVG